MPSRTQLWAGALVVGVLLTVGGLVGRDAAVSGLATGTADGFTQVALEDGCRVYVGEIGPSGVPPMRAECVWSDVTVQEVHAVFSRLDRWQEFLWCISDSRIVRTEGDKTLVWQRQSVRGLQDRENEVWMSVSAKEDGYAYAWDLSTEFSGADDILVPKENVGAWTVRSAPGGGVVLTNEIRYDPAGSVPSWLVRWFQTRGALQILADVHVAVASGSSS